MRTMPATSRRTFLGQVAAGVAAAVDGSDDPGPLRQVWHKRPIVGSGAFTYEVIHDWGELPAGLKYGNTHGVCEDRHGNIYVHHTVHATSERHDTMVVFDKQREFVRSWGSEFEGGAHGLHIRREGRDEFLYLCDTKRALVTKVTPRGETVWQLATRRNRQSIR